MSSLIREKKDYTLLERFIKIQTNGQFQTKCHHVDQYFLTVKANYRVSEYIDSFIYVYIPYIRDCGDDWDTL